MGLMMLGHIILINAFKNRFTAVFINRRLQNDRPSWGKEGVMNIQIIGLERKPGKDRRNRDDLTIRKMKKGRGRCHGTPIGTAMK